MAVTPYKAVVPEDYTYLVVNSTQKIAFDGSTTSSGTLSNTPFVIDASSFDETYFEGIPSYNIVGEYLYSFLTATKNITSVSLTDSKELSCKINVGDAVGAHYRYIRFILKPNLTIKNNIIGSTTSLHIFLNFSVVMNSVEHSISKRLTTLKISSGGSFTTKPLAFVFDTKTHTIMDYTNKGINLWSSL